jgi:UDP-3-O-[3-hydroxymyristoyl] N-acetylglucosamine deacetylase
VRRSVRLCGPALHAGVVTSVELSSHDGPLTFQQGEVRVALADARVVRADHGVTIAHASGLRIDLVEHLLAALGGLSRTSGVLVRVEGPELPLLDGGALRYSEALLELAPSACAVARHLTVTRRESLHFEDSAYHFAPRRAVALRVRVAFEHAAIGRQEAAWDGSPDRFLRDIARARTFGFRADVEALWARGRAGLAATAEGVAALAGSVLVFGDPADPRAPPSAQPHEIARHKLLDLIGDLTLYGGPPHGSVIAERPGHRATHDIVPRALASGLLQVS